MLCTSSECETTALNAPNTAITPTMAKPSANDCNTTGSSIGPPTVNPPNSCGRVNCGVVNSTSPTPCVVTAVSSMRTTAKNTPTPTSNGNALAYGPGRACAATASAAMPITSATYTGLGASEITAAAASAQTSQTPACHGGGATARTGRSTVGRVGAVLVTSLICLVDSDRGSSVRDRR